MDLFRIQNFGTVPDESPNLLLRQIWPNLSKKRRGENTLLSLRWMVSPFWS